MYAALRFLFFCAIVGAAGFWILTMPKSVSDAELAGISGDAARGENVFWAGGCASCHAAPGAEGEERLVLAGGKGFPSDFGTFYAPNISPSAQGIQGWSVEDLANAMIHGVSPEGQHYYPAFPYTSYIRADIQDIADLHAFLQGLPMSDMANKAHDVGFPFNIRRGLGVWKHAYLGEGWVMEVEGDTLTRGRYLVESLGHCSECHTPRNMFGGLDTSRWMAGAPVPGGKGKIPNITPHSLDWIESDITAYLTSGFTPEFDSAGGEMAEVVENMAHLPESDRAAISAYLKALPAAQ
jgi:mono/diheme cytochrome c family protein